MYVQMYKLNIQISLMYISGRISGGVNFETFSFDISGTEKLCRKERLFYTAGSATDDNLIAKH